jgi:hypothetical protein
MFLQSHPRRTFVVGEKTLTSKDEEQLVHKTNKTLKAADTKDETK